MRPRAEPAGRVARPEGRRAWSIGHPRPSLRSGTCHSLPSRDFLDAVTSGGARGSTTVGGHNTLDSTAAHFPSHPRGSALRSQGKCARVTREVLQGQRPSAPRVNPEEKHLSGRGQARNFQAEKHSQVLAGLKNRVQQTCLTQLVSRHGLRVVHRGTCWALGRPVSGGSEGAVFSLTDSSIPP